MKRANKKLVSLLTAAAVLLIAAVLQIGCTDQTGPSSVTFVNQGLGSGGGGTGDDGDLTVCDDPTQTDSTLLTYCHNFFNDQTANMTITTLCPLLAQHALAVALEANPSDSTNQAMVTWLQANLVANHRN